MLQNHDESSLMRDMGIMPVPKSLGSQPTWITYNKQFQNAKYKNTKNTVIEVDKNKVKPVKPATENEDEISEEETDMS